MSEIKHRSAFSFAFPIMAPMGLSLFVPWFRVWAICYQSGIALVDRPVLAKHYFAGSMEFVTIGHADGGL